MKNIVRATLRNLAVDMQLIIISYRIKIIVKSNTMNINMQRRTAGMTYLFIKCLKINNAYNKFHDPEWINKCKLAYHTFSIDCSLLRYCFYHHQAISNILYDNTIIQLPMMMITIIIITIIITTIIIMARIIIILKHNCLVRNALDL